MKRTLLLVAVLSAAGCFFKKCNPPPPPCDCPLKPVWHEENHSFSVEWTLPQGTFRLVPKGMQLPKLDLSLGEIHYDETHHRKIEPHTRFEQTAEKIDALCALYAGMCKRDELKQWEDEVRKAFGLSISPKIEPKTRPSKTSRVPLGLRVKRQTFEELEFTYGYEDGRNARLQILIYYTNDGEQWERLHCDNLVFDLPSNKVHRIDLQGAGLPQGTRQWYFKASILEEGGAHLDITTDMPQYYPQTPSTSPEERTLL